MGQPVSATGAENTGSSAPGPRTPTRRGTELLMLVFTAVIVTVALTLVGLNQEAQLTRQIFYYGLAFLALFGLAHLAVRRWAPHADPLILPLVAFINGLGLVIIHRVDLGNKAEGLEGWSPAAPSQILYSAIAVGLFVLVLVFVKDHRTLAKYGYTCGLAGLVALAAPAVLPNAIAPTINGAKLWIRIGPLSFQPAEIAKILLLIFFAAFLVSKRELFTTAGRRFLGIDFPRARDLAPVLVAWAASIGIVVLERDLGTSLLFFGIVLVMIYIATERAVWIAIGLSLFALGCVIAYSLFGHVQERVDAWLNPMTSDSGYQLREALFGMATGGLTGSGLGGGQPAIVPYAASDFILSSVAEELGLVGLAALLVVYLMLTMRGLRAGLAVRDSFGKLLAGGLSFAMLLQVFVVAGGVTGLIPLTGLTTPFLAAGGSSLVGNYILVGLLLRISDASRRPQTPAKPRPQQAPIAEAHTELVERPR